MKAPLIYTALLSILGCEQALLGPNESNDPENNFEILWNDFDKHYSLFNIRGTDWNALYNSYRPEVNLATTDTELWDIMARLIENLDDSHTVIYDENEWDEYRSGFSKGTKAIEEEFSMNLLITRYVKGLRRIEHEKDLRYAKIKNRDIGYILLRKEGGDNPLKALDRIFNDLSTTKAIILDLRTNRGGSSRYTKVFAGGFSDGQHLIGTMQTRNGPGYDNFDDKTEIISQVTGDQPYLKPVVVLTDRATISAGEHLTLFMKSFGHVTHIGDTTAGDLSSQSRRRFLPNGWSYNYSVGLFLLPNGKSLDGKGIAPDIYAKNSVGDIKLGNDVVMGTAINFLFEEYGIR